MRHEITTQKELRRRFWQENPQADRQKITHYSGKGKMHTTDTRCNFCDWLDAQHRAGLISDALANRATL
jgi:hypothetical protein